MVIDAGLPDGDDLWMTCQLRQGREKIKPLLGDIRRVDADDGVDRRETLGKRHGPATALQPGTDRDDAGDAGLGGPGNDPLEIRLEIRIVEMGVRLDQFHVKNCKR